VISISRLYLGREEASDRLRYQARPGGAVSRAPVVVVWNATARCNLACIHCYSSSGREADDGELTTAEGLALIDDLAAFGVQVLLLSGGEPLMRPDWTDLIAHARERGLRVSLSTNGTLLDAGAARRLKDLGITYAGISLDGMKPTHDRFRGRAGAFESALAGVRAGRAAGLKVGLRYTLTRHNAADVPALFDLIESENVPRVCFYHLVYSGRGAELAADDLDRAAARRMVDLIVDRTAALASRGRAVEVLTVDNHCDGPYLHLRLLREGRPEHAAEALRLLRIGAGRSTGQNIGGVSWDGTVFPDQFWRTHPLGNVRERPFSAIWSDDSILLLRELRDRAAHVRGRCAACRFLDVCGGNFRARGEAATGETWGVDPACYLTDDEIAPVAAPAEDEP